MKGEGKKGKQRGRKVLVHPTCELLLPKGSSFCWKGRKDRVLSKKEKQTHEMEERGHGWKEGRGTGGEARREGGREMNEAMERRKMKQRQQNHLRKTLFLVKRTRWVQRRESPAGEAERGRREKRKGGASHSSATCFFPFLLLFLIPFSPRLLSLLR